LLCSGSVIRERGYGQTIILQDLLHGVGQIGGRRASPKLCSPVSGAAFVEEPVEHFVELICAKRRENRLVVDGIRAVPDFWRKEAPGRVSSSSKSPYAPPGSAWAIMGNVSPRTLLEPED